MAFHALWETLCKAMRRNTCRKIFIANFLVFAFNMLLYMYNTEHSQIDLLRPRNDVLTTSPTTNHTIDWKAPEMAAFVSSLDTKDRNLLDRTFRKFIEAVESANLTYFMIGGTLLGSLRHHGQIPWDDDIDVMLNASEARTAKHVLSSFDTNFGLYVKKTRSGINFWKYFPVNGRKLSTYPMFRTPFVDIWFFSENETHIWNADLTWKPQGTWPKHKIFPLTRRPFGELSLPAPCNGIAALGSSVNISMCYCRSYNHLLEKWTKDRFQIPCIRLVNLYPFVTRSSVENSYRVKETLMLGNWSIREIMVDKFC